MNVIINPQKHLLVYILSLLSKTPTTLSIHQSQPLLVLANGSQVLGSTSIAEYLASVISKDYVGCNEIQKAQIHNELLKYSESGKTDLKSLNKSLESLVFLVGNQLTLADIALYASVYYSYCRLSKQERLEMHHLTRYFDLIQHRIIQPSLERKELATRLVYINLDEPIVKKESIGTTTTTTSTKEKEKENVQSSNTVKQDKQGKQVKEVKQEKKEKQVKNQQELSISINPSLLDIRVGRIISIDRHPDADSLYVEQVDLGEEKPRTVVSGLVKFMPMEHLQDKFVVLLCNLKPAKMRGIESQAMVLTAEALDGSKVELLKPPKDSKPGDVAYFEGYNPTPEPILNPKKKIWEEIQGQLSIGKGLEAVYKDSCCLLTSKGKITSASLVAAKIK